ncbi:CDP-diacylglycerol O-phosphatidyltransferase [Kouleothrix aurantiaca]|jgi:phosphatidylcholine synthase|uniref:Phosphatidylcholine synthase n=1 Tax=Kouleothrix aurantiaca TaxID=186479 RepID=A0A0P9F7J5_9CHLR|nr:CDP-diacylglycerol O-phosphatidyltransferase [Kouleothrix aurantiaca]
MIQRNVSRWSQLSAAAVHLYTASGAVLAFLMVLAAIQGNAVQALWISFLTLVVDGTDGMLARRFRVSETLPWFDGRKLDDIVDYLTYVFAPILLIWQLGLLPAGVGGVVMAALPLLASSYQFCRVDAKTDDHFFLGFPSYWNVIAFYAIVLNLSPATVGAVLIFWSIMVFVPIRYLYPTRTVAFRSTTLTLSALWLLSFVIILAQMPTPNMLLVNFSLLYMVYYVILSLYMTFRTMRGQKI